MSKRGNPYALTMGFNPVPYRRPKKPRLSAPPRKGYRVRPKMVMKRPLSFTKTQQRRRKRRAVQRRGQNSSASTVTFGKRWLGRRFGSLQGISGKKTIATDYSTSLASSTGQQFSGAFSWMNRSDLTAVNLEANGGVSSSDNLVTYLMRYVKNVMVVKNQSNHVVKVQFYDLVCRADPVGTSADDPIELWRRGYTDVGASSDQILAVGNSPLRSAEFRKYFWVKRVITHDLEPGEQHTHTVYHRYNRLIRDIDFLARSPVSIRTMTGYTLVVFSGSIGHESAVPTSVTYMPARIDVAVRKEIVFQHLTQTQPKYSYTNNLPGAITDFDFMGEADDQDANPIIA